MVDNSYIFSVLVFFLILFLNLLCLKRDIRGRSLTIYACLWVTASTVLLPLAILAYGVFFLVWMFLGFVLFVIHGDQFIGLFSYGYDTFHSRSVMGKSCINVLLMAECEDETLPDEIFKSVGNTITSRVLSRSTNVEKLFSVVRRYYFGFCFLLKQENIQIFDCVKKMKTVTHTAVLSQSDLRQLLMYYTKQQFPFDNNLLWDVHVGAQPVQWKKVTDGKKYYPILFRFQHCLADAVNIFNFISGVCGYSSQNFHQENVLVKGIYLTKLVKLILKTMLCVILNPAITYTICVTRNWPFSTSACAEQESVIFQVDEQQGNLNKLIKISKKLGVTFTAALLAAFSASLTDYYSSQLITAPEYTSAVVLKHPESLALRKLQPGSKDLDDVKFTNEYDAILAHLPIRPKHVSSTLSMLDRVDLVMNDLKGERGSFIFRTAIDSFLKMHFTVCPEPLLTLSTYFLKHGTIVSNVPGTPKICLGESLLPISDYIFYVSGLKQVSFILTASSYDNRLSLTLRTPEYIESQHFQKLLSDIYLNIDKLEREADDSVKNTVKLCVADD